MLIEIRRKYVISAFISPAFSFGYAVVSLEHGHIHLV